MYDELYPLQRTFTTQEIHILLGIVCIYFAIFCIYKVRRPSMLLPSTFRH